ncbi:MAG: hypothetical protein RR232_04915 [Clostridia bacterium]
MEEALRNTINMAKMLIQAQRFNECEAILSSSMMSHPHDAIPHNLMGLLLEKKQEHANAMKHFRAAYALDPSYRPAAWNLECFGEFYKTTIEAYCIDDCMGDMQGENGKAVNE